MTPMEQLKELCDASKLTLTGVFVPFSQSRNKDSKYPNLNWKITLLCNDREVLTTDYSQGVAHLPRYGEIRPSDLHTKNIQRMRDQYHRSVCETGKAYSSIRYGERDVQGERKKPSWLPFNPIAYNTTNHFEYFNNYPIPLPAVEQIMYSLLLDGSSLFEGGFENWCSNYGYDTDSIKAKALYDQCVEIGSKLISILELKTFILMRDLAQEC